jgi:hypothetical protein
VAWTAGWLRLQHDPWRTQVQGTPCWDTGRGMGNGSAGVYPPEGMCRQSQPPCLERLHGRTSRKRWTICGRFLNQRVKRESLAQRAMGTRALHTQ